MSGIHLSGKMNYIDKTSDFRKGDIHCVLVTAKQDLPSWKTPT